ncbi:hypothetical protein DH2020_041529 [Rehmannia glutinosa]|uniref:Retrotransposon gag domain-containing protein n=1 Tax=Rehmannia glutinosa TaxID=99300 RepID=A0ABR0UR17_REHGL
MARRRVSTTHDQEDNVSLNQIREQVLRNQGHERNENQPPLEQNLLDIVAQLRRHLRDNNALSIIWWERIKMKRNINDMTWVDFENEFLEEFFHLKVTNRHYDEFTEFRQGDLPVEEAVRNFNRLARLCPELVREEKERVRLMLKMFRPEIALNVTSGVNRPQTAEECLSSALIAEHYLNNMKVHNSQQRQPSKENQNRINYGAQKSQSVNRIGKETTTKGNIGTETRRKQTGRRTTKQTSQISTMF